MIVCLTDLLGIGNFACLTVLAPPLLYSIRWEYLSGLSGHPGLSGGSGLSGLSGHFGLSGHKLLFYQFYLVHLWTDFQSCFCIMTSSVLGVNDDADDHHYYWVHIIHIDDVSIDDQRHFMISIFQWNMPI